ncbi:MAG: hypothetical protein LJE69_11685 [Thiohalocapsa sp.]|jgi:predicted GTPase|uniref:dynamin family protein n=1 Tax=Thiohalocapsa sp. TaxID=2497641 RepID=UPI0025D0DCB3|nr:dynamin family protein [Thiohalocapsa sp.]MCG6941897.1 hypothetical protein [Thiohalocapsa sp.]
MHSGPYSTEHATLKEHLAVHGKWRSRAVRAVHDLRGWLRGAGAGTAETDARLARALAAIETDQLTVVVAGAAQRGKTELINALFFAEFGRRLLPVKAAADGCPLEIQWQPGDGDACLRLLPIEYLASAEPLEALKATPARWVRLPLHPQEPEQINATLAEMYRTKRISLARARRLGLRVDAATVQAGTCEVPCWRHALLSFPHPLLKKGLVLLDLPGLTATERDGALHRELLRRADALLVTIAADRGAEAADLTLWREHLRPAAQPQAVILVALTRADLLGADDNLRGAKLERLAQRTATALAVDRGQVHAVSAHDGLAAKIADKPARLRASGIDALEATLAEGLITARRRACRAVVDERIGGLLENAVESLAARSRDTEVRIHELLTLDVRSAELVARTLERTRDDEQAYLHGVQMVQRAQRALHARVEHCCRLLEADAFEHLARRGRARLRASWSTGGLRRTMRAMFDELRCIVARAGTDAAAIASQTDATYAHLGRELGLTLNPPPPLSLAKYRLEMDLLHAEAVRFAQGGELLLTLQTVAIRRFERRLVQRARVLFEHLREDIDRWLDGALAPLVAEVEHRKANAERRLARFQLVKATREEARAERAVLLRERVHLAKQLTLLRNIRNALDYEPSVQSVRERTPYLVTSDGEPVRRSG